MASNLPESDIPDLRDYLFVDRQRVGSLLAQFAEGLPSERAESANRSRKLQAGIKNFFSIEEDRGGSDSQTLALADLHVSQLEENAEALGMLADVSEQIEKRKNWLRGKVRNRLKPGMLLRVTAPTQISDISTIISTFRSASGAFQQYQANDFIQVIDQIESLYGQSISVSIRTAGEDDFQIGFVGEIPHEHEFGPMRRELLLSQVGPQATELTTLMQVAAVPTEKDTTTSPELLLQRLMPNMDSLIDGKQLNRLMLDQIMTALGGFLAEIGIVAAPKWPAISVVPLAIYRQVEPIPDLKDED